MKHKMMTMRQQDKNTIFPIKKKNQRKPIYVIQAKIFSCEN